MLKLRKSDDCLKDGEFELLLNENDTSVYTRTLDGETVYVVSRYSSSECAMPECIPENYTVLLNNYADFGKTLKPYQSVWLKKI
jgi:hypothetical protein